ncbi:MAG: HAMP domain-containing histidine kinase, partial [Gammaproteobacteria bacterium]|nr:HAMP domain-containing histidine kinase [Gammaproteobacteria bacterium]
IIMINGITEARTLQTALERYKRLSAMGEMSAKVAHQIRTPLASALLYTSNLTKRGIKEDDRNRFADKALDRMRHLEKVVNDMLSFTRDASTVMAEVSLGKILNDLAGFMEAQINDGKCELIIEPLLHDNSMRANRDALLSVMQNLISNAIQACGEGGKIHVVVDQRQQHQVVPAIDIYFSDNGPGISEEDQKRIFEPFFTTKTQGTGLGLAVAQNVVQSHGGSLWIARSDEDGTTFVMRLPIIVKPASNSIDPSSDKRSV